ncbi:MAG TPA: ABC transporter ATP-binding protein [Acidimicrobiales bacterium]|nr:ABC transporter ATP-binding protein [Acidimicrobiales bacterium]
MTAAAALAPPAEAPTATTIAVDRVSKWLGPVVALSDVSFSIGPGVTALLGPNGAGKSTLLRILCGLTGASQGTVRVLGVDPRTDLALRGRLGLVAQQESLFEQLRAVDIVALSAGLHGVPDSSGAARDALGLVDLDPADARPVRTYSKGMRQRVKVAAAVVHDPTVVVLDEPLEGLDPRQRLRMIELFVQLGAQGRTVLVSSHVLDEVERFGSQVLVLAKGRLAASGDFRAIRDLMDERPHRLRLRASDARRLAAVLMAGGTVVGTHLESAESVLVDTVLAGAFRRALPRAAAAEGIRLLEITPLDDDLDSVFRYLVDR